VVRPTETLPNIWRPVDEKSKEGGGQATSSGGPIQRHAWAEPRNGRAHATAVLEREGVPERVTLVKVVRARTSCRIFAAWAAVSMTRPLMIDGGWCAADSLLRRTRRPSFIDARERPSLEHRVIAVLVARDDDVVENRQTQDFPGPHDVGGRRDILGARGGII
jgi:hypothetical protein